MNLENQSLVDMNRTATIIEVKPQRDQVVRTLRQWGGLCTDAILDPHCKLFLQDDQEGLIGYRLEYGCAVVYGDPVCPESRMGALTSAFHRYCEENRLEVIYLSVSEKFASWSQKNDSFASIEYGEELMINPQNNPKKRTGTHASLVRRKIRHAQGEGVVVHEYKGDNEEIKGAIEKVGESWLSSRDGPQIHISHVRTFDDPVGKRWFYAEQGHRVVGVITLNRLEQRQGWLMNHLMITPEAPNGTPEILVVSALEIVAAESCQYVSFGSVPGEKIGEIIGLGKMSSWLTHSIYDLSKRFFRFGGYKKFWEKFYPEEARSYLLFRDKKLGLRQILALKKSLNVSLNIF